MDTNRLSKALASALNAQITKEAHAAQIYLSYAAWLSNKGYGGIAAIFFLVKKTTFKIFFYLFICFLTVGLLPLCFYSFARFTTIYMQWFECLKSYGSKNAGISVMGIFRSLIYKNASTFVIQLTGVAVPQPCRLVI